MVFQILGCSDFLVPDEAWMNVARGRERGRERDDQLEKVIQALRPPLETGLVVLMMCRCVKSESLMLEVIAMVDWRFSSRGLERDCCQTRHMYRLFVNSW